MGWLSGTSSIQGSSWPGLTGWSTSVVNNATLHSGKLPIMKTAETLRPWDPEGRKKSLWQSLPSQCEINFKKPVFWKLSKNGSIFFPLKNIFQVRLRNFIVQDPGEVCWVKYSITSTCYIYFLGGWSISWNKYSPPPF